ncbi:MAG: squalene/phytoene synthase family protein [Rhodospirillales bacterium]
MATLSYCCEQFRRFDSDRFVCSLFAPAAEREAIAAVYAFNIEVARIRESVVEPMLGRIRLQWWRDAVDGIYAGRPLRQGVVDALAAAVEHFGLSRRHIERVLEVTGGNRPKAARILGINPSTIYRKLEKYNLIHKKFEPN